MSSVPNSKYFWFIYTVSQTFRLYHMCHIFHPFLYFVRIQHEKWEISSKRLVTSSPLSINILPKALFPKVFLAVPFPILRYNSLLIKRKRHMSESLGKTTLKQN